MQRLALILTCGFLLLGAATIAESAGAEPADNSSQRCHSISDEGWATHGECVSNQTPQSICRSIEEFLAYPYLMQIYIRGDSNTSVPAGPPIVVEQYGNCVGGFGPHYVGWIAIHSTPLSP